MKHTHFKALSLILCLLMMAGAILVPVSADEPELTGEALLKAYGITAENPGTGIDSATIEKNGDNSYLVVGLSSKASYHGIVFDSVPLNMTEYTFKADMITTTTSGNKAHYLSCGKFKYEGGGNSLKSVKFGARTSSATDAAAKLFVGDKVSTSVTYLSEIEGLPAEKHTAKLGDVHSYEVTISATAPYVTMKLDGVDITPLLDQSQLVGPCSESILRLEGYKGFTYGFDNIYVVNNATGEVVYNEDFEETPTAPVQEGKVFAGWYQDSAFTTPAAEGVERGYAKFVNREVLGLRTQLTAGTTAESASTNLRLLTSVDSLDYAEAGFIMTCNGVTVEKASSTVYSSILALGEGVTAASQFADASAYFVTYTITDIPQSAFASEIVVTPYWVTADGVKTLGDAVTVTVNGLLA